MSLIIRNLNKIFGRKEVFSNFSYEFNEKGLYVITGESGRGKTTLLRLIAGLDNDYSGEIKNGGKGAVSFHFQEYRLFDNLTVLGNITEVSFCKTEEKITKAQSLLLKLGILNDDFNKYPSELSGGMKIRVSFARAVLKDSPILLLDEALKELDLNTVKSVCEIIREEANKRLVILVTHKIYPDLFGNFTEIVLN